jgi:hypothetical protein
MGAGHLEKIHLRLLQQSDQYELVGFMIPIKKMQKDFERIGYKHFSTIALLFTQ